MYNIQWKMFMFLFLFFSMLLLCSFFRLKELFQVKKGVTTLLLFFFLKIPKNWFGWTTVNGEKKEDGLIRFLSISSLTKIIITLMFCTYVWLHIMSWAAPCYNLGTLPSTEGVVVDILWGDGVMQKRESPDFLSPVVGISAVMGLYYMQDYI